VRDIVVGSDGKLDIIDPVEDTVYVVTFDAATAV
jgi:hypothetical protein